MAFAIGPSLLLWGCGEGPGYSCQSAQRNATSCKTFCAGDANAYEGHEWSDEAGQMCESDNVGEREPRDREECEGNRNGCKCKKEDDCEGENKCVQCQCRCKNKR